MLDSIRLFNIDAVVRSEHCEQEENKVEQSYRVGYQILLVLHVEAILEVAGGCYGGPEDHEGAGQAAKDRVHVCEDGHKCKECEGQERVAEDADDLVELNVLAALAHQVYDKVNSEAS